jgi:hypothetical protein
MMMRMLEAGGVPVITDGLRQADADNPNGYYEYEPVKLLKQDSSWLPQARGKAVKMVYLLLCDLPPGLRYDVIFMRRDLEEVVASQDAMLRRGGAATPADESRQLIGLFRDQLRNIEAWLLSRKHFRILDVDYGLTIQNPRETCDAVKAFLHLDLHNDRMQSVVTKQLYRQRREA